MLSRRLVLCATGLPFLGGCLLFGDHEREAEPGPELVAMSRDEIRVGQRLELLGDRLEHVVELRFEGEFRGDDGSIHRVDQRMEHQLVDDRVVIPYFGPYQVPFGDGDEIGVFTGTVTALEAGEETGAPFDVELRVLPSIIVTEMASADVSCEQPARRLIGGGRLHLTAAAIGFEADEIAVRLGDGAEVTSADGMLELDIPAVADGALFAIEELALTARGAGGDTIDSDYLIGVHRSVEYFDSGHADVAQIEAPVPVSGCYSGGDTQGRTITYAEQEVDERARTVGYNWNVDWLEEHGEPADLETLTELGLRHAVDGPRVGPGNDEWTVGDEVTGGPAFDDIGDDFWQVSSIDVVADEQGMILPGEYGVWYRQATRLAHPGAIAELDACGIAQELAAEAMAYDYSWEVDLAQGAECPPFPEPDLAEPECLIAPCL